MRGCPARLKVRGVELGLSVAAGPLFLWGHGLLGSMAQEDAVRLLDWSPVETSARLVRYDGASQLAQRLPQAELDVAWTLEEMRRWPDRIAAFVRSCRVGAPS